MKKDMNEVGVRDWQEAVEDKGCHVYKKTRPIFNKLLINLPS